MELGAGNKLPKKETILSKTGIMTDSHSGILQSEADELGIGKIGEAWLKHYKENGGTGHVTANMKNLVIYERGKAKMPNARILIKRKKQ